MTESGDKWNVTILVHAPAAPDLEHVARYAADLTRSCDGHVDGLLVSAFNDAGMRMPGWLMFLIGGLVSSGIWRYLIG